MSRATENDGRTVVTRIGADVVSDVLVFTGEVRDQIILMREAVASMRENDLSDISLEVKREKWSLSLTARRKA